MRTLEGSNRVRNGVMGIIILIIVIGVGQSFASVLPKHTADQPESHAIVREMRALLETYADRGSRVLIGLGSRHCRRIRPEP